MQLPETELEYRKALQDAAEIGVKKALQEVGLVKPFLTLAEAKRLYGAKKVQFFIDSGLIFPIKDGPNNSQVRIDRIQIETVAKTSNRAEFFAQMKNDSTEIPQ